MTLNFLPNDEVIVFSTNRASKEHKKQLEKNRILQKSFTLSEFLERAVLAKNAKNFLKKADNFTCLYYLKNAINRTKSANEVLGIPSEFFAFLKSSEYIFSFFRELKSENVGLNELFLKDIYANYEEHLSILQTLSNEYEQLLANDGYYDKISPLYEINTAFITEFKKFKIELDGFLSKYELSVIKKLCEHCEIIICLQSTKFNEKLLSLLTKFFKTSLEIGFYYEIQANTGEILLAKKLQPKNPKLNLQSFSLRSLQCAFVFDEISKMKRAGLRDDEIIVILPDESFAGILANADNNNMLNYAMGKSVKKTMFYVALEAINTELKEGSKWAKNVIKNLNSDIFSYFKDNFNKPVESEKFEQICSLLLALDASVELENIVYNKLFMLFGLAKKFKEQIRLSQLVDFLLLDISNEALSLVGGGGVTAMGILESRGLNPKGVIIVDFNDNLVPKRLDKEMFLSSQIRASAGLASHSDRENLQKNYYYNLISNCDFLSISYYKDDEGSMLSRFFDDLGLNKDEGKINELCYENALFASKSEFYKNKNLLVKYSAKDFFSSALSYSKLRDFLDCHEIFYYKYVHRPQISPPDDEMAIRDYADYGSIIHKVFENYFKKFKNSCDLNSLKAEFKSVQNDFEKSVDKLEFQIFLVNLPKIVASFNAHFAAGWRVYELEAQKEAIINGIKIKGKIDRIDINENGELMVIDYKSGSLPDDDLQLLFYKALSGATQAKFFDLKNDFKLCDAKNASASLEEVFAEISSVLSGDEFDFSCKCAKKHKNEAFDDLLENDEQNERQKNE